MTSKNGVFGKILAVFLVLIIISGSGFLAYNFISGSTGNMASMGMDTDQSSVEKAKEESTDNADNAKQEMNMEDSSSKETSAKKKENASKESSSNDSMDMGGENSTKENMTMSDSSSSETNTQYSTPVITAVLKNKESLENTIVTLNDTLSLLNQNTNVNGNNESKDSNTEAQSQNQTTDTQGNTIVNVYPQNGAMTAAMENMETTYDAAKMEQLHTGFYKAAIGMQLLDQLKNNLSVQLESASVNITNPSQYYNNQYLSTVQNKNKLTEALNYINEASSLVNINPYVSKDGVVYDQEKMGQLHDSINNLATAIVNLNTLGDDFSQQSIQFSNLAQNSPTMSTMDMDMGGNIFSNVNMATVFNVLVIAFILIFIISIFGYISKLLKSPKKSTL